MELILTIASGWLIGQAIAMTIIAFWFKGGDEE